LDGDIQSWIVGEDGNGNYSVGIKVKMGENGDTTVLTEDIAEAVTAADGQSIHVKLASGDELDLPTQI